MQQKERLKNVISYEALIFELEDLKWTILLNEGDISAATKWPAIDSKLDRLYRWYHWAYGNNVRPFIPRVFK